MYLVQLGPIVYAEPHTLVQAMRTVYGVGHARVLRADLTPVVLAAGSASAVVHAPTGRELHRRKTRR